MVYNSPGYAFASQAVNPIRSPTTKEPTVAFNSLTTAQCAANGSLTSKAVTSTITLVEAASNRANGITLIVPSDQPGVTFGNQNTGLEAIQAISPPPANGVNVTAAPSANGFYVPPGGSIFVTPCYDAVYAVTPTGVTATIYFMDPAA